MKHLIVVAALGLAFLGLSTASAGPPAPIPVYRLYRSSAVEGGERMRYHIASFDADVRTEGYNRENCEIARGLFQGQPGVVVRFWCERYLAPTASRSGADCNPR